MKRIKIFLPLLALALFSCSDYLEVNDPLDNPTGDQITPNLSLAGAQTQTYRPLAINGQILGSLLLNNWGFQVNSFAVTNPEEFSLSLSNNTGAAVWDGLYPSTNTYSNIINHPAENYENHKAIAKILKSFYFQYLVDMYGDIPYSEAHLGNDNLTPSYDDDQAIYRDLVVQIEDAIATIDNPLATTIPVGEEDVIFGGNMQQWKRFGNTLKLRLLLRQSEMTDGETATYLAGEFAELEGAEFLATDATINPGYSNGNEDQQSPLYGLFYDINDAPTGFYRQYGAADFFANELNSNPVDPRRSRLFTLVGGNVVGVIQGDFSQNAGGTAPPVISNLGPGYASSASQDGYMMLLAESKLLQAEAVHRGYLTGDAQALFNEAIAASFSQLGAADVGTYIVNVNGVIGKGYGAPGATPEQQIEAIIYQKKVALSAVNTLEVYIEYTRTGFIDDVDLALGATKPNKPRRLLYPTSELASNTANVPALTLDQIFVQGPFWWVP